MACILVFQSGFLSPVTKQLSSNTWSYVASSIGVNATVAPNELNQITAQLTAKERELDQRERALNERQIQVGLNDQNQVGGLATYVLSSILFILLVLMVLNYILDYLRSRPRVVENQRA